MAAIHRDELRNDNKAIELFSKVLDDSPLYPKAFEAIEKLFGEGKQWKELERAYRKQIKRLPQDTPSETKLRLWDALAEVALKQHDKESAALTMEVAASLDRDNLARQERLASRRRQGHCPAPVPAQQATRSHRIVQGSCGALLSKWRPR
jgi:tetratricopeptide (TPR) repeat protein